MANKTVRAYTNKSGVSFSEGDTVKLTSGAMKLYNTTREGSAKIISLFHDIKGLVMLSTKLGGYITWDVKDLEKV